MPDKPPRLFLSYGVRDASDIAERLHRDLTACGYKIWQDIERIRSGWAWDNELEDGLLTSDVMLALLSPHSVRQIRDVGNLSQVDSVCLDEIAYARDPCHIPIVPVKVMSCQAPLLINRLHQIDFRRWNESEPVYQAGLNQIYEAIETARRGEKRERAWGWLPKPWDFEPFLREKRKGFVGREWLFAEIDGWRGRGAQPALLIAGEPGIGKSAIVAALVHENPGGQVLAYHCCQADTPTTLHPAGFVRNLAAMLSGRLDDYAAMLEDPAIIKVLEEVDEDPASAFEAAILAPLLQLPEPAGTGCYLLIDALDEALAQKKGQTIVALLSSRINRLPAWLRIVATTRNDPDVLNQLRALNARELDAHDEQNLRDLRRFITGRLTTATLQATVIADGRPGEVLTEKLLTASSGNFLYVTMALKAVESGQFDFKTIDQLPPGLSGMYRDFFDRLFVKSGVEFRQTRDVLEIVVVAREPLRLAEIAGATGLDEDYDLPLVLDRLAPFLPARELRYSLFHKSLSDWFTGKDPKTDRKEAGPYHVSLTKGRTRLADWCWDEYQHGLTKDHLYCLRYLPAHLAEGGRDGDLRTLLLNFNWLQTKLEATDPYALIADYDYLPEDKDLRTVQSVLRNSAHILADNHRELPGQLLGRLPTGLGEGIDALRTQASGHKSFPWLRPFKPSLSPGGPLVRTLAGHSDEIHAVAVTPDGRRVISGSWDNTLRAWDLATGKTKMEFRGHTKWVCAVAVTGAGRHVISGSWDKTLRVWDLATGETKMTLEGHSESVKAVAVTPDGRHVVSGSTDKTLRVWDLVTGETKKTLQGHTGGVDAVAVTPDGRYVVSGSMDKTLRVWDLASGKTIMTLRGHDGWVLAVAVTPNGRYVISGSADGTVRVWDLATSEGKPKILNCTGPVDAVVATPDGCQVVSCSRDGKLCVWDLATGEIKMSFSGHTLPVYTLVITPDGRHAITGSADKRLCLWDLATDKTTSTFLVHSGSVNAVAVAPDGSRVISGSADCTLRVWDPATGEANITLGHTHPIFAVAVTPDGRRVISGSYDGTLRVWDLATGKTKMRLQRSVLLTWILRKGFPKSISAIAVTPDGRHVITGSAESPLQVWDLITGKVKRTLQGHSDWVTAVAVTPDSRHVVSGSWDNTLRVWDLATGETKATLQGHSESVNAVAVTPDGRHVVSGSADNTLRVWDLATGETKATLQGHTNVVHAVAVTPDGRHVISVSDDSTLRVWNLRDEKELVAFTIDGVRAGAVTMNNCTIVVGDSFGRMHFLRLVEADETKACPPK